MRRTGDSKQRLIASAIALMYERGYNYVGVKEICARAEVNKGSFYHFFPSKRDLTLAALDTQWSLTQQLILEPAFARDVLPLQRFHRLFDRVVQIQKQTGQAVMGCFFGNLALELSTQDEAVRQKLAGIFQEWTRYFEMTLTEAVAAGDLTLINIPATAQAMLAYFEGVALLAKTHNDPTVVQRLAQGIIQLTIPPTPQP